MTPARHEPPQARRRHAPWTLGECAVALLLCLAVVLAYLAAALLVYELALALDPIVS